MNNYKNSSHNDFLDLLKKKIIIFDGPKGTNLQKLNLDSLCYGGDRYVGCNDFLTISYPQAVEAVHRSFLDVGVDVIVTNTFRSNRLTLSEYGLQDRVIEINQAAASLARKLADEYCIGNNQRYVAGSIGPSGKLPSMNDPEFSNISFDDLSKMFFEQANGLIQGGVDLLIIETSQDILEAKAAIYGIQESFKINNIHLPIQVQVTLDTSGRMLQGTDIAAVLAILEGMPIDIIGLNCSTGPEHMRQPIQFLKENSKLPVSCLPNAGLPLNIDGNAVYPMEPEPFTDYMVEYVSKYGLNIVGGCCGTTPAHIKLLVEKLHDYKPTPINPPTVCRLASAIQATPMHQEPPPFLIGERLNSQGSRKFKELLLNENFDGILTLARQQIENGAHGLDICVALTERSNEAELMQRLIKTIAPIVPVPLVIDTTEPEVLELALKTAPGRCLINSVNLESGRVKADRIFNLAKNFNAAVIALTIDEQGMAKSVDRKLEIANRIFEIAINGYQLRPGDLVFDTLTFTLATGDPDLSQSAIETLESIRRIKSMLPGTLTSLGVSNVSFGLKPSARAILNSVMLYHAVQAGLDMAIVNPAQITPYTDIPPEERILAENLIFNKKSDALQHLISYFEHIDASSTSRSDINKINLNALSAEERLHYRILHRIKENIECDINEILARVSPDSYPLIAVQILNTVLLPAMKEVGEKFGNGELILPFVLQSAEVMKKSVLHLEQYLEHQEGASKGLIILATVYGDVHDIGKNLVKTILSNNGYQVCDLGKQVPAELIINKAIELKADAIGLSALLVSTSKQMPIIVNELHRRNLNFPVLIGGAAINPHFGSRILFTDTNTLYEPGVYYCKDAFEGLATMDALSNPEKRQLLKEKIFHDSKYELERNATTLQEKPTSEILIPQSTVQPTQYVLRPPKWGAHVVNKMPLEAVFQCLSKKDLYRLSWGGKNIHGEEWKKLEAEFETRLEKMHREALIGGWLNPQCIYGYFPAQSEDNTLIIYDPFLIETGSMKEIQRFNFPRQPNGERLCLADYFSSSSSKNIDLVAFQIVTIGQIAAERIHELQNQNDFSEAYFTHGLSVQMAEATAEYIHRHIRKEIGISFEQGKRYSWGYPAIPDLEDHTKVFQLLPVEKELGMKLTSAYQMIPEQSTAAIIVHHPSAKYFNVRETRKGQQRKLV